MPTVIEKLLSEFVGVGANVVYYNTVIRQYVVERHVYKVKAPMYQVAFPSVLLFALRYTRCGSLEISVHVRYLSRPQCRKRGQLRMHV